MLTATNTIKTALQHLINEREVLLEIGNVVAATKDKKDLVNVLADKLRSFIPFDDILLTLYDEQKNVHIPWVYFADPHRRNCPYYDQLINACHQVKREQTATRSMIQEPVIFKMEDELKKDQVAPHIPACKQSGLF